MSDWRVAAWTLAAGYGLLGTVIAAATYLGGGF